MGEAGVLVRDGRLGDDLAAALEPRLQDALNHPTRRDVLRVLHEGRRPRSIAEILQQLAPLTRGQINYHVQGLQHAGCVVVEGTRPAPGGREQLLRSTVSDDDQALLVLRVTERSDREHRQESEPSSTFLTMFRIPRPGRTIKLKGARRSGEAQR